MSLLGETLLGLIEERRSTTSPYVYMVIEQDASQPLPEVPQMRVVHVLQYRDVAGKDRTRVRYEPVNSFHVD